MIVRTNDMEKLKKKGGAEVAHRGSYGCMDCMAPCEMLIEL